MRQGLHHQLMTSSSGQRKCPKKRSAYHYWFIYILPIAACGYNTSPYYLYQVSHKYSPEVGEECWFVKPELYFFLEESVPEPYLRCGWIFAPGRLEIFISLPRHRQIWSRWFFNGLWQHNSMYVFYWGGNINVVLKMPGNLDYFNRTQM